RREFVHHDIALETSFDGALVESMIAALKAEDPSARAIPYCMSGGTDNKTFFADLGVRGFGLVPLRLPADGASGSMSNGGDERAPIDALQFGARVLARLLLIYSGAQRPRCSRRRAGRRAEVGRRPRQLRRGLRDGVRLGPGRRRDRPA